MLIDSSGYDYPETLVVQDMDREGSYEVTLLLSQPGTGACDECKVQINICSWNYHINGEDIVFHPNCLFKQPCHRGLSVLIRGGR